MLINVFNTFTKITGWPIQALCFRTKVFFEDPTRQRRQIKGPAILVSNHTSVFDYAVYLFVFFFRTLRFQMAEVLFKKQPLGLFLRCMGGIYVDRTSFDFGFLARSEDIIRRGGVVGIFPESRIPTPGEQRPLEFKPSAAYLALSTQAPVIPLYTNGSYFNKKRAKVIIGAPMDVARFVDESLSDKENISRVNDAMRRKIVELETLLDELSAVKEA